MLTGGVTSSKSSHSRLPRVVVLLGITSLLTDVSSEMILPLIPSLVLGGLGGAAWMVGLIEGVADALSAVLKLVFGRLSDRMHTRKPFALFGYALSTAVRPLVALASSPWHIVVVRAVDRVGKGVRSAPRDALIADSVEPSDQPRAFAFHRQMDHTGAIAGPLVASALLAFGLSASQAIVWAWIPGVLAVLALSLVREPAQPAELKRAPRLADGPLPPALKSLLLAAALFSLGVLGDLFVLVRARDLGVAEPLLPILWAVLHVAKVLAAGAVARTNVASRSRLAVAWLVVAIGIALLLVPAPLVVWAAAVVLGLGHGAREPLERALVGAQAPAEQRGRAFGLYHLVTGLCALPAGLVVGIAWDRLGAMTALSVSLVTVVVGIGALSLRAPRSS